MKTLRIGASLLVLAASILGLLPFHLGSSPAQAEEGSAPAAAWAKFDFNDSTMQGWTLAGAFDEHGHGPFTHSFWAQWWDYVNYPNLSDYTGDGKGSIMMAALAGHGVTNPDATFWLMQLHSPDLTDSPVWQAARGYSVQLAERLAIIDKIYANLYVRVYDTDQARDRWFYTPTQALPLTHNAWTHMTFDWSTIATFPAHRIVREVFVNLWGKMSDLVEGAVYLDEVTPLAAGRPSLIAARKNTGGLPWLYLYNAPAGMWTPVASQGSNQTPIPTGDIRFMFSLDHNGDGVSEIAAVKVVGGVRYLYVYTQPMAWAAPSVVVAANALPIPAGDVRFMFNLDYNGDGREEVAALKIVGGVKYLYIYAAPVGMWTPVSMVAANALPIAGGDILWMFGLDHNGDGKDEVAAVKVLGGVKYLYIYAAPAGMWTPVSMVAANASPIPSGMVQHVFAVDRDGDGKDEIGVVKVVGGVRYLYIYSAPAGMWTPVSMVAANASPIPSGNLLNIFSVKRGP